MSNFRTAIIGGGNLGQAIVNGLLSNKNIDPASVTLTRRDLPKIQHLSAKGIEVTSKNVEAVKNSKIIILAVKPYNLEGICTEIKSSIKTDHHIVVSTVSGVSIDHLKGLLGENVTVFRAMPNTAADVQESVTCLCGEESKESYQLVKMLFNCCGSTIKINENLMESATVLGACGIAYVLRFMRAMVQGGIQIGFDAKTAEAIVNQTVIGAATLLTENGNHAEAEIDKVTTPKGCTIAGLNEMEHNGFSSALIKGITTSFEEIG
jgi:pyrroline-5-carboxylate reductase